MNSEQSKVSVSSDSPPESSPSECKLQMESYIKELGTEHPLTLDSINNYARLNYDLRNFVEAEEYYRRAWHGRRRAQTSYLLCDHEVGPSSKIGIVQNGTKIIYDLRIFETEWRLAKTLEEMLRYKEAEPLYIEAISGIETIHKSTCHIDLVPVVDGYSIVLHNLGESRYEDAFQMYKRLLHLQKVLIGEMAQSTLSVINRLALLYRDMNKLKEAEDLCVHSLEDCTKVLGQDHPTTQQCVEIVAFIRHSLGQSEEAEDMFRLALACNERILGENHPTTLRTVVKIGVLLNDQKLYQESEIFHKRALIGFEQCLGKENPETIDEVQYLGELMLKAENIPEAENLLRRALSMRRNIYPGSFHPKTMDSAHCLAVLIHKQTKWKHDPSLSKRKKETELLYTEALNGRDSQLGIESEASIESASCLAEFLNEENRINESEILWKRVFSNRRKILGNVNIKTAHAAFQLGLIKQQKAEFYRGIDLFQIALKGYESALDSYELTEEELEELKGKLVDTQLSYDNCLKMNALS
jgi:tetratricopeptide (TPR) repeat protein